MGKVDDNKKLKMNTLLQTAFDLLSAGASGDSKGSGYSGG